LSLAGGIVVLLAVEALTITVQPIREMALASSLSVVTSMILGYRLVRVQLFQPLTMQTTQLHALREISQALTSPHHLEDVLRAMVQQARQALRADFSVIMVEPEDSPGRLIIGAQDGGSVNLVGRIIEAGEGIGGRVFKMKQSLRIANYSQWEGKTPTVADLPLRAAVTVPLIYDNEVVGVLTVGELKAGRQFHNRDQAILEMLAPQAAIAIVNARLRQRLHDAPPHPENV
jgi:GAF domain-containing protein